MLKIILNINVVNINDSIDFYKKIGFQLVKDEKDSINVRHVQMNLSENRNLRIRFLLVAENNFIAEYKSKKPMLSIIKYDIYEYLEKIKNSGVIYENEINEPWGAWVYFRDPSGNLLCISNKSVF